MVMNRWSHTKCCRQAYSERGAVNLLYRMGSTERGLQQVLRVLWVLLARE